MRTTLEKACNNFIKNRDTLKNVFKWEHDQIVSASALAFLNRGILADEVKLEKCKKLLKENTNLFSSFRGNVEVPMVAQLAMADVPENKMEKTRKVYGILKQKFYG